MGIRKILLMCFLGIAMCASAAHAGELEKDPKWLADKVRLENLVNEELTEEQDCEIRWNILWPWAKE